MEEGREACSRGKGGVYSYKQLPGFERVESEKGSYPGRVLVLRVNRAGDMSSARDEEPKEREGFSVTRLSPEPKNRAMSR